MKGLKIVLWAGGLVILVFSLIALMLPWSTLESLGQTFGTGEFPEDFVAFPYTIRAMTVVSVMVGAYYIILALNPGRYGILVPFTGVANVIVGLGCLFFGISWGAPVSWYLGDFLCLVVLGVLILYFWSRSRQTTEAGEPDVPAEEPEPASPEEAC